MFDPIYYDTWRSVLLMEETGVPGENNIPTKMTDKLLYHNVRFVCLWCLWCSTIFQLYRGGQFYWWRNWSSWRKPLTFRKSLTKFHHKMFYQVNVAMRGFQLITLVVVDNDCICSCKSNCHASMTKTSTSL